MDNVKDNSRRTAGAAGGIRAGFSLIRKLTPHAAIILSAMYFVFFFIDRVNRSMNFINNAITKALLFILCVLAIFHSVQIIRENRRAERERQARLKARQLERQRSRQAAARARAAAPAGETAAQPKG